MRAWKEPGLFNNYHEANLESGASVSLEESGEVMFTTVGGYYGDDVYTYVTLEEIERLGRAAHALKEYAEAERQRVARLNATVDNEEVR